MQINSVLLIDPAYYSSQEEDMEHLYNSHNIPSLLKAAQKCEKFHSYFHYEESFFHTILASLIDGDDKRENLEKAVKLSPLNQKAFRMLNELDISNDIMSRPYPQILDYMRFATENNNLQSIKSFSHENFWDLFDKFNATADISILKKAMQDLNERHMKYHQEAGEIYHAIHLLASKNNFPDIAKFAILKAQNLNPAF